LEIKDLNNINDLVNIDKKSNNKISDDDSEED
jgi:hypothetical protein